MLKTIHDVRISCESENEITFEIVMESSSSTQSSPATLVPWSSYQPLQGQ